MSPSNLGINKDNQMHKRIGTILEESSMLVIYFCGARFNYLFRMGTRLVHDVTWFSFVYIMVCFEYFTVTLFLFLCVQMSHLSSWAHNLFNSPWDFQVDVILFHLNQFCAKLSFRRHALVGCIDFMQSL